MSTTVTVDGYELELSVTDGLLTVLCGQSEAAVRIAEPGVPTNPWDGSTS